MGVTTSISIVEWSSLQSFIQRSGNVEEFVELFPPVELRDNEQVRQMDFLDAFSSIQEKWRSRSREQFELFFGTLFWTWGSQSQRVMDLQTDAQTPEWIESAFDPTSVRRFAGTWREANVGECAAFYEPQSGPFETHAEFAAYANEWGQAFVDAENAGKGIVICCWG